MEDTSEGFNKELVYDLRQVYATEIVGEHLKDIARARKADDYSNYFKCLRDLYVIVQHKFKDKKKATEKYTDLLKEAVKVANEYPQEWLKKAKNSDGCAKIEEALNKIEMFLYNEMEEAKMFGRSREVAGL